MGAIWLGCYAILWEGLIGVAENVLTLIVSSAHEN